MSLRKLSTHSIGDFNEKNFSYFTQTYNLGGPMRENTIKPSILSIFRGEKNHFGKIIPRRRVGKCLFYEASGSHVLHIDLLPGVTHTFFLKPSLTPEKDYAICIKEPIRTEPGKYLFREVGVANLCDFPNEGLLYLEWDFLGPNNIYMQTLTLNFQIQEASA